MKLNSMIYNLEEDANIFNKPGSVEEMRNQESADYLKNVEIETVDEYDNEEFKYEIIEEYEVDCDQKVENIEIEVDDDIQYNDADEYPTLLKQEVVEQVIDFKGMRPEMSDDDIKMKIRDFQRLGIIGEDVDEEQLQHATYITAGQEQYTELDEDSEMNLEKYKRTKLTPAERLERRRSLRKITWVFLFINFSKFSEFSCVMKEF